MSVNRMPRAVSLQHAMKQVASDNPPLVVEFDGENHFGAWVRKVQTHNGPKVVEGLTRAFPGLVEKGGGSGRHKRRARGKEGLRHRSRSVGTSISRARSRARTVRQRFFRSCTDEGEGGKSLR